ncbi:MAG: tripartite tricarboxylate transporter substrate binding protein [Dehalobacterium sp.]
MFSKLKIILAGLLILTLMSFTTACSSSKGNSETSEGQNAPAAFEPSKTVEVLVGFAPGGGTDLAARKLTEVFTKEEIVKQPIIVNNLAGGMGVRALTELKAKKGDPNVLLFQNGSADPIWSGKTDLDISDFKLVAGTNAVYRFILVGKNCPYQTLDKLLDGIKNDPKLKIGVTGTLEEGDAKTWAQVKDQVGVDNLNLVTTGGTSEVLTLLLQGQVDAAFLPPVIAKDFLKVGDLAAIASMTEERVPDYPDVPTFKEVTGSDITYTTYMGIWFGKEVPDEAVDFWYQAIQKAIQTEDWQNFIKERGMLADVLGPDEYQDYIIKCGEEYKEFIESIQK